MELVLDESYPSYTEARREIELKAQNGGKGFFVKTGLDESDFRRR